MITRPGAIAVLALVSCSQFSGCFRTSTTFVPTDAGRAAIQCPAEDVNAPDTVCKRAAVRATTSTPGKSVQPALFAVCDDSVGGGRHHPQFLTLDQAAAYLQDSGIVVNDFERKFLVTRIAEKEIRHTRYNAILRQIGVSDACRCALDRKINRAPASVEKIVSEMLTPDDAECSAVVECGSGQLENGGGYLDIKAEVTLRDTSRPGANMNRLRRAIDPHSWKACMGDYFTESCQITGNSGCRDGNSCAEGNCELGRSCAPVCESNPAIGNWKGFLSEEYHFKPGGFEPSLTSMRNVFEVDWSIMNGNEANGYTYRLHTPRDHSIGADMRECGVELDNGFVQIDPLDASQGTYEFRSTKRLRFCGTSNDSDLNQLAPQYMCVMAAAVEQNVCCQY